MDTQDLANDISSVDRTIHAPARLMLMTFLHSAESVDFLYLLRETGLTKGNLASHLAKLEERHYLTVAKGYQGKIPLTTYALTKEGREAFQRYREQLQRVIDSTEPSTEAQSRSKEH